ncbi:SAM-dependent chlorinase/fluorinase [Halomicrobium sp. IBSBa]|uniref:SAM hydrolase/SAM-dependent halogenase family protein n=1 Tax=Halomicrobium sp. IBSBa TaxID=2778916 RepID=UPI001ABF6910|nr:SAM-dependent chlorinase/fluorinase [Halomicrobium sp. IBSBa]MBO4247005.1 SAM-dependent chlorinase/fluorinase [Halomicrobium sp. IBSBa]
MITLSSDFGSPYPAAMKGVILQDSDARIVDVSHEFPRQDVPGAAFWLREVLPYFPPAVHCVVVDPGVGTDRAAIVVRVGDHAIVAPDNGVALPAARAIADDGDVIEVFEIETDEPASATFHGRDVFAPMAAVVHETGVDSLHEVADLVRADGYEALAFPEPTVSQTGASGAVLVVDGFGNAITNVPGEAIESRFGQQVRINGEPAPVRRTYATVEPGQRLVTVGSHGNVELAVNRGRGDEGFRVDAGDRVELSY